MKSSSPNTQITTCNILSWLAAGIIVLIPFHALLTVWAASLFGHYTEIRLWKEILLALVIATVIAAVIRGRQVGSIKRLLPDRLLHIIILYLLLLIGSAAVAVMVNAASPKAAAYGLLLDGRYIVFFLAVWYISYRNHWIMNHWRQLLLVPAVVVVVFGFLQFALLPPNFLSHFGYGPDTIAAVQTVDEKDAYQRVQSTLRGANPFGAYLVIIISACGILLLRTQPIRRTLPIAGLLLASLVVLGLTFSRSAWLGAMAAIGWIIWQSIKTVRARQIVVLAGVVGMLVFAAVGYSLRDNDVFQNTILHTDENSQSLMSSNQGHLVASLTGAKDIIDKPLGSGIGTAGPASVYNTESNASIRISENYFIQIGQEVGIVGMSLFILIIVAVAMRLWQSRELLLPQVLLASLIGISVVNLLSHAWTDDTLSYIWWGLAGTAIGHQYHKDYIHSDANHDTQNI